MAKGILGIAGTLATAVVVAEKNVRPPAVWNDRPKDSNESQEKIKAAIKQSRDLIMRVKDEYGLPGIVVGVSVDGKVLWKEGMGYSDLENQVPAHEDTVMRIASISKSLTAAVVGRLWQEGLIDIDQPIQKYVPSFPEKSFGAKKVVITTRQLMCHLSGIRHYSTKKKDDTAGSGDGQWQEFYSKERYENIEKALSIFKNDELLHAPGSKYLYSTYGWTVVSAAMEGATGKTYPQLMGSFLRDLGMRRTYLDELEPIIYGRSRCYGKNKNGRVINSPYVDNSCKWAGGGFLSTVGDLLKFSHAMLYAYQFGGVTDVSKAKQVAGIIGGQAEYATLPQRENADIENLEKGGDRKVAGIIGRQAEYATLPQRENADIENLEKGGDRKVAGIIGGQAEYATLPQRENADIENLEKGGDRNTLDNRKEISSSAGPDTGYSREDWKSNLQIMKVIGSGAVSTVKSIGEGVAGISSYAWNQMSSALGGQGEKPQGGKDSSSSADIGDPEKDRNSNLDKMKDIGSGAVSTVKSIGEGVAGISSYAWNQVSSAFGGQGEKPQGGKDSSSSADIGDPEKDRNSNLDKMKDIGSGAVSTVKSIGEGVAGISSYAWNQMSSALGGQGEKPQGGKNSSSSADIGDPEKDRNSNLDKMKDIGSGAVSTVKSIGEGVAGISSYAWNQVSSAFGGQGEKPQGGKDSSSSADIGDPEKDRNSNLDKMKNIGSGAVSTVKSIGEGVAGISSYAWNQVSSAFGGQGEKPQGGKDSSSSADTGSFSNYAWSKLGSLIGNDKDDGNKQKKESEITESKEIHDEQESRSWTGYLKSIFTPRALDSLTHQELNFYSHSTEEKSLSHPLLYSEIIDNGVWFGKILPVAVNAVLGHSECLNRGPDFMTEPKPCESILNFPDEMEIKTMRRPYISQNTIASLWTRVENTKISQWGPYVEGSYGLGFGVAPAVDCPGGVDEGGQCFMTGHTGGAVGASSAMVIVPRGCSGCVPPKGVAVVILTNLQSVSLNPLAVEIARIFANVTL